MTWHNTKEIGWHTIKEIEWHSIQEIKWHKTEEIRQYDVDRCNESVSGENPSTLSEGSPFSAK